MTGNQWLFAGPMKISKNRSTQSAHARSIHAMIARSLNATELGLPASADGGETQTQPGGRIHSNAGPSWETHRWTQAEDSILREYSPDEAARMIGRSLSAVYSRRRRLDREPAICRA